MQNPSVDGWAAPPSAGSGFADQAAAAFNANKAFANNLPATENVEGQVGTVHTQGSDALPPGWEIMFTPDGQKYYSVCPVVFSKLLNCVCMCCSQ